MAVGMFDDIGEMSFSDLYVAPPRGTSGVIRYTGGPVKPSDLIRDELAETQFIRDFLTEFSDKLGDKDASEWIRVLGEYATGEAELSELEAVDVSDLMEIEGFEDYYYGVVPRPLTEDTGVSDQDAISAVMATVPDKLKGLITEDNIIKVLEEVAKMNDPMTQIKRDMGAGIEIEFPEDWRNWKVFGPLAIPGVPLPPGIIDVTLGDISDAVETVGKKIEDFIEDPIGTLGELGDWVTKKVEGVFGGTEKDPGWGGSLGGFEDWVIGVLGNVVGGSVLIDVYDNVKDIFETDTTAVVGGTDTDGEDETKADIFKQLLGTVEGTLEVDPDLFVGSITDDDDTPSVIETGGLVPEPPVEPPELPPEPPVDPETPEPPVTPGSVVAPPTPLPPVTPPEVPPEPPVTPGGGSGGNGGGSTVVVGGTTIDNGGGTTIDVGGLNYPPETPIEIGGTEVSTGGGGAVGGGDGMFTGVVRRPSYMPQVLPGVIVPAPVDSMATIEGLIGRMLTGRIS